MDLDPATLELDVRVAGQPRRDLRKDRRSGVDEHPPLHRVTELGDQPDGIRGEVVQLGQRLDTGVAGTDEDEPEVTCTLVPVGACSRRLELPEDAVAKGDSVGHVLEAQPVLREPGHGQRPRHRAHGHDEPLVGDRELTGKRIGRHETRLVVE